MLEQVVGSCRIRTLDVTASFMYKCGFLWTDMPTEDLELVMHATKMWFIPSISSSGIEDMATPMTFGMLDVGDDGDGTDVVATLFVVVL